jgi:hypothetical protein
MSVFSSPGLNSTPTSSTVTRASDTVQPYVKNVLDKGNALLNAPAPTYTGQMTAGTSDLQKQAFDGLAGLTLPDTLTSAGQNLLDIQGKQQNLTFDPNSVSQYMNPYLQNALNPQLEEARRQAAISSQPAMAKLTQAGGFGGGRQAVLEGMNQRDLNTNLASITGKGYKDAYDEAMKAAQYSSDFGLKSLQAATATNQAAANTGAQEAQYGLSNLQAQATAGKTQYDQEQAGLNAQYNEFLRQQKYVPDQLKAQQELIRGMPGGTTTEVYGAKQSGLQRAVGATGGITNLIKNMKAANLTPAQITAAIKSMGINPDTLKTNTEITPESINGLDLEGYQVDPNTGLLVKDGELYELDGNGVPVGVDYSGYGADYGQYEYDDAGGAAGDGFDSEGNPII